MESSSPLPVLRQYVKFTNAASTRFTGILAIFLPHIFDSPRLRFTRQSPLLRPTTVNFIMYIPVYRGEVPIHPHFSFPPSRERERKREDREWDVIIRGVGESFWWKLLRGKIFGLSSEDLVVSKGRFLRWWNGIRYRFAVSKRVFVCLFLRQMHFLKISWKSIIWC